MVRVVRKSNFFEKLLIIVGAIVVVVGMFLINQVYQLSGGLYTPETITAVLLWLILIFVLIIAAISENAREELGIIVHENSQELKILRQISKEQIEELRLLRKTMSKK